MTISELINKVNAEKPNGFSEEHLLLFINECEAQVQEFLGVDAVDRVKYELKYDKDEELIAPSPYDGLYEAFLKAKMDYINEEHESYENNQVQFSSIFYEYKAYAMREGLVKTKPLRFSNWY